MVSCQKPPISFASLTLAYIWIKSRKTLDWHEEVCLQEQTGMKRNYQKQGCRTLFCRLRPQNLHKVSVPPTATPTLTPEGDFNHHHVSLRFCAITSNSLLTSKWHNWQLKDFTPINHSCDDWNPHLAFKKYRLRQTVDQHDVSKRKDETFHHISSKWWRTKNSYG